MAVNTKVIKQRIKSIGNIRKITKAMEMISAVKMRRAVSNVLATRSYSNFAWEMLTEIAKTTNVKLHPLLERREVKRVAIILITSNRGLAGGFTSRLLQEVHNFISTAKGKTNADFDVFLTGKQGKKIYYKFGHHVSAEFDKMDITTHIDQVMPMVQLATSDYVAGKYDLLLVAYTDFESALRQVPKIKQILPLEEFSDTFLHSSGTKPEKIQSEFGYKFEPDARTVLDALLPRLIEMQIYQAILESDASEHSARMLAMRNATDSAKEIIKELQYSFNKARQSSVTQEISEIVGGAAALE